MAPAGSLRGFQVLITSTSFTHKSSSAIYKHRPSFCLKRPLLANVTERWPPRAIFNPLDLAPKRMDQMYSACGFRIGEETPGPLTVFATVWPWDCVGCSSAPMTQRALFFFLFFLCASLQADSCSSRVHIVSLFIKDPVYDMEMLFAGKNKTLKGFVLSVRQPKQCTRTAKQ